MHRLFAFRVEIILSCVNDLNFGQVYKDCLSVLQRTQPLATGLVAPEVNDATDLLDVKGLLVRDPSVFGGLLLWSATDVSEACAQSSLTPEVLVVWHLSRSLTWIEDRSFFKWDSFQDVISRGPDSKGVAQPAIRCCMRAARIEMSSSCSSRGSCSFCRVSSSSIKSTRAQWCTLNFESRVSNFCFIHWVNSNVFGCSILLSSSFKRVERWVIDARKTPLLFLQVWGSSLVAMMASDTGPRGGWNSQQKWQEYIKKTPIKGSLEDPSSGGKRGLVNYLQVTLSLTCNFTLYTCSHPFFQLQLSIYAHSIQICSYLITEPILKINRWRADSKICSYLVKESILKFNYRTHSEITYTYRTFWNPWLHIQYSNFNVKFAMESVVSRCILFQVRTTTFVSATKLLHNSACEIPVKLLISQQILWERDFSCVPTGWLWSWSISKVGHHSGTGNVVLFLFQ